MRFSYFDFAKIYRCCVKATDKSNARETLRYIELRSKYGYCVATALDGHVLCQVRVQCEGDGVILIPPIKPMKCFDVDVQALDNGNVKIAYLDFEQKLICAYEIPGCSNQYFEWYEIVPYDRKGDRIIYCSPSNLLKALECFKGDANKPVCISIPENPVNTITISSSDEQALVLPMRINDGSGAQYRIKNMYIADEEAKHE